MASDNGHSQVDRRGFLRIAGAAAAVAGLGGPAVLDTQPPAAQPAQPAQPMPMLGNGEAPALQFQAYPGGTGALLERLAKERGRAAFDRASIAVESWRGDVPTSEEDVAFLPVHCLSALLKARKLSSVELTDIYLARLERYDPTLLCVVTLMKGQAREAAQQADAEIKAGHYRGPLHGVPWGVKDLFATRGVRTTWGSADFENRIIDADAEVVVRLRDAGAVLLAKLATGMFAQGDQWYRGQTKNPWNVAQGSSGSSAGPASATAAGCVAFAIGTETQGSIVSPAMRCGLSALRPTFGRVSRYGGMVLGWSMDKVGPICRTIEDCALVFNTIHGSDEKDPATLTTPFQFERSPQLAKYRIGYDPMAPQAFIDTLRELGAKPEPMRVRPTVRYASALPTETATAFDFHIEEFNALAADSARGNGRGLAGGAGDPVRFTRGRAGSALEFLQSQRQRLLLMREMRGAMEGFDMYVSANGDTGLTNQTGHPAVVVPYMIREGANAQPVCTTIIGDLFADDKILSVANAYQRATAWHLRRPALM